MRVRLPLHMVEDIHPFLPFLPCLRRMPLLPLAMVWGLLLHMGTQASPPLILSGMTGERLLLRTPKTAGGLPLLRHSGIAGSWLLLLP